MNRAEYMSKVHGLFSEEDAGLIELAYMLAKKFHRGQMRKELDAAGQPLRYFEHVRRVSLILLDLGISDATVVIAALLHDMVEDTDEVRLANVLLERLFGSKVAACVRALSKTPKAGYIERLKAGPPCAMVVKAADRLDNIRSLPADDWAFCARQREETRTVYLPMFYASSEPVVKMITDSIAQRLDN